MNSKLSVKLKLTPKIGLRASSRNMNDSQAIPATLDTNEDEKSFKETVEKIYLKKPMKGNHSSTSLETLTMSNLKFTRLTSKN